MSELVMRLGDSIDGRWSERAYLQSEFADVALTCLRECELARLDPDAAVEELFRSGMLPRQVDVQNNFGDPPLTIYRNERFFIDILFWHQPTPGVHDHAFSGAFAVLKGTCIHCSYRFHPEGDQDGQILLGRRELIDAKLVDPHVPEAIDAGPAFIHSVWHLSAPSASIVVRTFRDIQRQYSYEPRLAIDQNARREELRGNEVVAKRLALLSHYCATGHPRKESFVKECLRGSSQVSAYEYLKAYCASTADREKQDELFALARLEHGPWTDVVRESFRTMEGPSGMVNWKSIPEEGPRLLAVLLLCLVDRDQILEILARRYPDEDIAELVAEWAGQIADRRAATFSPSSFAMLESLL